MNDGVGVAWESEGAGWSVAKGENWDNYNSIINEI